MSFENLLKKIIFNKSLILVLEIFAMTVSEPENPLKNIIRNSCLYSLNSYKNIFQKLQLISLEFLWKLLLRIQSWALAFL